MEKKYRVHIVGTHGVPASYGGFETLADILCQKLGANFDISVYCNANIYKKRLKEYYHARLIYIPLNASGFTGIFYDLITFIHALFTADVILYLSPVGSGFMTPLKYLTGKRVIINHGGLNEWEREKLSFIKQKWAKFNHWVAARFADINVVDNEIYQQSLKQTFNADSVVIKYGGDHASFVPVNGNNLLEKYPFVKNKYAVSISRAQVDNNLHIALEAFEKFNAYKLVLVSNWDVSEYGQELKTKYKGYPYIILLDAIYDKKELDFIRANSYVYIHTHSRCGTAPSLVEAMWLKKPVVSFDVATNRETTQDKAEYFSDSKSLVQVLEKLTSEKLEANGSEMYSVASSKYVWDHISTQYKNLFYQI